MARRSTVRTGARVSLTSTTQLPINCKQSCLACNSSWWLDWALGGGCGRHFRGHQRANKWVWICVVVGGGLVAILLQLTRTHNNNTQTYISLKQLKCPNLMTVWFLMELNVIESSPDPVQVKRKDCWSRAVWYRGPSILGRNLVLWRLNGTTRRQWRQYTSGLLKSMCQRVVASGCESWINQRAYAYGGCSNGYRPGGKLQEKEESQEATE